MARRNRDLAGLAALGALGMYAARSGKDQVRPAGGAPVEDRRAAAQAARDEDDRDVGMISGANPAGLYRNTESGDLFSVNPPEETPSSPASAATRSMKPATRGVGMKESAESETRGSMARRRNVQGDYTRKMGATAEEIDAYNRSKQSRSTRPDTRPDLSTAEGRARAEQEQALEGVYPEQALGGVSMRGLHTLAKGLANRPPRQLMLPAPAARPPIRGAGEGFVMYKKGGAVKAKKMASGGSTSSASKRADGIATKGKTKCKIY